MRHLGNIAFGAFSALCAAGVITVAVFLAYAQ